MTDGFFPAVHHVAHCQEGVAIYHPGAGISHHLFNPFFHCGLITMHRAIRAGRFLFLERTPVKARFSVIQELPALTTKFPCSRMMIAAVNLYHGLNRPLFSRDPRMCVGRCRSIHGHANLAFTSYFRMTETTGPDNDLNQGHGRNST